MSGPIRKTQDIVHEIRRQRGFVMEPQQIFMMLTEEVGEIATELKHQWSKNYNNFSVERLSDELADAMVCLMALANQFDIDLDKAVMKKFIEKDSERVWLSAPKR